MHNISFIRIKKGKKKPRYTAVFLSLCHCLSSSLSSFLSVCLSFFSACCTLSVSLLVFLFLRLCLPSSLCFSACLPLFVSLSAFLSQCLCLSSSLFYCLFSSICLSVSAFLPLCVRVFFFLSILTMLKNKKNLSK